MRMGIKRKIFYKMNKKNQTSTSGISKPTIEYVTPIFISLFLINFKFSPGITGGRGEREEEEEEEGEEDT